MKRIIILLSVIVLVLFTGCGAPKGDGESLRADSTDDIMTSGNFNTIGEGISTPAASSAGVSSNASSASSDNSISVSAAFSAYQTALNNTLSKQSYIYSGKQTYSAVIDGATVLLESYITDAKSDGANASCMVTVAAKDKHNKEQYSAVDGLYAVKDEGVTYVYSKYSDYNDPDNSSQLTQTEDYAKQPLSNWLDTTFEFGKNDVASASVGSEDRYTFTLKTDRAKSIVTSLLGGIDLQEELQEVSVSYFVVTIRISDRSVTSYSCSVICNIGEDGTTYKLTGEYEIEEFDPTKHSVSTPDWMKK